MSWWRDQAEERVLSVSVLVQGGPWGWELGIACCRLTVLIWRVVNLRLAWRVCWLSKFTISFEWKNNEKHTPHITLRYVFVYARCGCLAFQFYQLLQRTRPTASVHVETLSSVFCWQHTAYHPIHFWILGGKTKCSLCFLLSKNRENCFSSAER